jgi:predicted RNA-binding Zn ribbon-like protein
MFPLMSYADTPPKLVGGSLCLDLINTVGWRGRPREKRGERLVSYQELLHWEAHAGVLGGSELRRLSAEARRNPDEAARVLAATVELREAVARLLDPASRARRDDLALLNSVIERAPARTTLVAVPEGGYRWSDERAPLLQRPLWQLAWDAADLLTSERRERVRSCGDPECGWMFLDVSRGKTRRWCSMEDCGNRAKARRHYARARRARASPGKRRSV